MSKINLDSILKAQLAVIHPSRPKALMPRMEPRYTSWLDRLLGRKAAEERGAAMEVWNRERDADLVEMNEVLLKLARATPEQLYHWEVWGVLSAWRERGFTQLSPQVVATPPQTQPGPACAAPSQCSAAEPPLSPAVSSGQEQP